ncbi:transferase [Streptomyces sp. NPDC003697]
MGWAERKRPAMGPTAIIGGGVIIGSEAKVWEFTTIRGHTLIESGASIGFNCEVTNAYVGADSVLGHRIGINRTLLGRGVRLSANVAVAAIHLTGNMTCEVILRLPDGHYRCRTARFGAVIGDHTQTGINITIGLGAAVGRHCQINSHAAIGPIHVIPTHHLITPPPNPPHACPPHAGEPRTRCPSSPLGHPTAIRPGR